MAAPLALALLLGGSAQAGAWTQPQGAYYVKIWDRSLIGPYGALSDGTLARVPFYQDHALNAYGELGLTDALTLSAYATPLGYARQEKGTLYLGTAWVGLRRALLRERWRLAVEARVGGAPEAGIIGEGTAEGEPWLYRPAEGSLRGELELQLGRGLGRGWLVGSAGLVYLSAPDLDPGISGSLQVGRPFGEVQGAITLTLWQPFGPIDVTNVSGAGETAYVGLVPEIAWWVDPSWALGLGVGGALYAHANAATPYLSLSVHHKGQRDNEAP